MWGFLTKKCGIFGIEGGTKLWDFQHRGGDFHPLTSGHTEFYISFNHMIWNVITTLKILELIRNTILYISK